MPGVDKMPKRCSFLRIQEMNIVTEQKQMPERLFLGSGFGFGDAGADAGLITLAAGTLLRLGVLLAHCFFPSFLWR